MSERKNEILQTAIEVHEADAIGGEDAIWTRYTSPIDENSESGRQMNEGFEPGEMGQDQQVLNVLDV